MQEVAAQSSLFINRELSWLAFNGRVLQQAVDARTPLLERVKFLVDLQHESGRVLHGARRRRYGDRSPPTSSRRRSTV